VLTEWRLAARRPSRRPRARHFPADGHRPNETATGPRRSRPNWLSPPGSPPTHSCPPEAGLLFGRIAHLATRRGPHRGPGRRRVEPLLACVLDLTEARRLCDTRSLGINLSLTSRVSLGNGLLVHALLATTHPFGPQRCFSRARPPPCQTRSGARSSYGRRSAHRLGCGSGGAGLSLPAHDPPQSRLAARTACCDAGRTLLRCSATAAATRAAKPAAGSCDWQR